jgi:hypothetical protein
MGLCLPPSLSEETLQGFKYIRLLGPLLDHLHRAATERDRAGNRQLFYDQEANTHLRDAALAAALRLPVPADGPLAGKRVRVSLDGGRVRTRRTHRGHKTAKGRHGFAAPWQEPRVLVIDILDEHGQPDRLRLPLYDVLLGDAEAIWRW